MGKKKPNPRYVVLSLRVDYDEADALDAFAARNRLDNRSDALRSMFKDALAGERKHDAGADSKDVHALPESSSGEGVSQLLPRMPETAQVLPDGKAQSSTGP